jgi:hypothetical protein
VADHPPATATYHFDLLDARGLSNISERRGPVRATLRLVEDPPPRVRLDVAGVGDMITPEAVLPISLDFSDAYGLAAAELLHSLTGQEEGAIRQPVPHFEPGSLRFSHSMDFSAAGHGVSVGDRLMLRAEATDYNDLTGPGVGESSTIVLRVVNADELLAELNRREQEYRQDFERLLARQEALYLEVLDAGQVANPQANAEERTRSLVRLARRQRDQASRLNVLQAQFEQILSELRINRLATPSVEERFVEGIIRPMEEVGRVSMAQAAQSLDALAQAEMPEAWETARAAQRLVREQLQSILDNMAKWEGFQEAVILMREVLRLQREVVEETESRIESELFGNPDEPEPSKP